MSADVVTAILSTPNFEADEKQCRSDQLQEHAERAASGKDQMPTGSDDATNSQKAAREYCIQRRSAIAAEYQARFAKWSAIVSYAALVAAIGAAYAAGMAAKAARDTVKKMAETAEAQLRAYVSARGMEIAWQGAPLHMVRALFSMRNAGQTPAYKVVQSAAVRIFPYPLPERFNFPNHLGFANASVSTIHPDEPQGAHLGGAETAHGLPAIEVAQACVGKNARFYLFGIIKYVDAFEEERTTKFCYSVRPGINFGFMPGQNPNAYHFEGDPQHNEAD